VDAAWAAVGDDVEGVEGVGGVGRGGSVGGEDFGDLSDAVAVGVEDVDFGVGGDAGQQGLIVGYGGVNDD
jgi:hypothetical protein